MFFFGHFLWHFLTAKIGNFIQFENSVAPHPAESKRQAITYISYLFAFFDLQVRRPAQLAWTLPFSLFEVLVEIRRNKWTLDYFKSISEKLRGIIFSFMQGNTSLLKRVCKEKSFQNNLFLDMISYRINILNEKRDQNKKSSIPFQLKHFHVAFINSHFPIFARQMFILGKGQKKKIKIDK